MIAASRRKVLSMIAALPFAGAAAAEQMADISIFGKGLSGSAAAIMGNSGQVPMPDMPPGGIDALPREQKRSLLKYAMRQSSVRSEIESLVYEECAIVTRLDHDLASKRSFSLAAKVTFQRQRNVEHHLRHVCEDAPWHRIDDWSRSIFKKWLPFI